MIKIIENIPNIKTYPLKYIFEKMKLQQYKSLWLEFGVASGRTINYISKFSSNNVFGFDSFQGLPEKWRNGFEKGTFDMNGKFPKVNKNVVLIKGWFNDTLPNFIQQNIIATEQKVSFIHIDCDLYSSTKYILSELRDHLKKDCIIVFDELVNYPGFDGDTGELRAFYEFISENNVKYDWIGMNGVLNGNDTYEHQNVAVVIHSVTKKV